MLGMSLLAGQIRGAAGATFGDNFVGSEFDEIAAVSFFEAEGDLGAQSGEFELLFLGELSLALSLGVVEKIDHELFRIVEGSGFHGSVNEGAEFIGKGDGELSHGGRSIALSSPLSRGGFRHTHLTQNTSGGSAVIFFQDAPRFPEEPAMAAGRL